jgi:hypothetical protein
MDDIIKKYNLSLKKIIEILDDELPSNPLIQTAKRKYQISVTNDRSLLITETGPFIYEYREQVAKDDWDNLIYKDWSKDINEKSDGKVVQEMNEIECVISNLRKLWKNYDEVEKKRVTKLIKSLITEYAKYICIMHSS